MQTNGQISQKKNKTKGKRMDYMFGSVYNGAWEIKACFGEKWLNFQIVSVVQLKYCK